MSQEDYEDDEEDLATEHSDIEVRFKKKKNCLVYDSLALSTLLSI